MKAWNELNSVLFEGTCKNDPERNPDESVFFQVQNDRRYKEGDVNRTKKILVTVRTHGKLGDVCMEYIKAGRGVRIVGRLENDRSPGNARSEGIEIEAEQVEIKPELKGGKA
jgi:single-strand DNA-binding protein